MADYYIHLANLLYLGSFLLRDMLWLRILTCCGLMFGIGFFTTCQPTPMYGPTFWHVTFLIINFYQIRHLLVERRRLRMSREEHAISRAMLLGLTDEELADSLAHTLTSEGEDVRLLTDSCEIQLAPDACALRDMAFSRLSRTELLNLLSRRMWQSVKRLRPRRRRLRRARQ